MQTIAIVNLRIGEETTMDVVKSQAILYMYDLLLGGNIIKSEEIINKFNITKRTFFNYVSEIKCYFANFYKRFDIIYDYDLAGHKLIEKRKIA